MKRIVIIKAICFVILMNAGIRFINAQGKVKITKVPESTEEFVEMREKISKTAEGWTWVDWQTCIGCGSCIEVCKYDSIKLAEEKALICDLCKGQPECVKRCPTNALEYKETPESTETPEHAFKKLREAWNFE